MRLLIGFEKLPRDYVANLRPMEQVAALNRWQACGWVHPFTCGKDGCGNDLRATNPGWICSNPNCNYTQSWLQHFAELHQMTYNDMMAAVKDYVDGGCKDSTIETDHKNWETPDEFWVHYKNVTGNIGTGDFFGCCI